MNEHRRVHNIVREVEAARRRALVYERLRVVLFVRFGHPDDPIALAAVNSIDELLLAEANQAKQVAVALLAQLN